MHLSNQSRWIYGILAFLWAIVIFVLSTMPGNQLPKIEWLMTPDKFGHAAVYGIFTFFLLKAGRFYFESVQKNKFFAAGIAILYGISMEIVQKTFFPYRYFEYSDIVANIIGVLLTLWIINLFFNNKKPQNA